MNRYFRKESGSVFKVGKQHDLNSLKERFTECDNLGKNLVKKEKPKKASTKKVGK